jgi:hypothetical protein
MTCPFQTYGFLFGCIPIRILMVYIVYRYSHVAIFMQISSIIAALLSIAFFILFFTKKRETGAEVCNGPIWWNNLRPFHGIAYLTFAILANIDTLVQYAYIPLLIDIVVGIIFHINNKIAHM